MALSSDDLAQKVAALQGWLQHPAWTGLVKPALLREREKQLIELIKSDGSNTQLENKLRALVVVASWILEWEQRAEDAAQELANMLAETPPDVPTDEV